ncbi:MAG: DUF2066 domain-containing protein, partial [Gammaproteobacteria bacterium]|nr:DUF2066 domain-containing protein [Gammaproteobacteria bacterium]
AGRPVRVYEVDVEGQSPAAVQDAMRQALVRATGRRDAAEDPALSPLIADAGHYVKAYATGPRGETQVQFDPVAVEHAIDAAGRSVWDRDRPFTLVVLDPPRTRAAAASARAELERVAAERGLPISLLPMAVTDGSGNPLGGAALLQAAQRYGGDEILVGRGEDSSAEAALQWTLYTRTRSESWNGPLAGAIDHAVDLLVPQQGTSLAQTESDTHVAVGGVSSLADYAAVTRLLQSVPGVRRANVVSAEGDEVVFDVAVRGGAAALEQAMSGSARLVRSGAGAAGVVYRYQPRG